MIDLKTLVLSLTPDERLTFALEVKCSLGHLQNVMYGYKPCAPLLASRIETVSRCRYGIHRTVKRWDLIPDEWAQIWPELVNLSDSPANIGVRLHGADHLSGVPVPHPPEGPPNVVCSSAGELAL